MSLFALEFETPGYVVNDKVLEPRSEDAQKAKLKERLSGILTYYSEQAGDLLSTLGQMVHEKSLIIEPNDSMIPEDDRPLFTICMNGFTADGPVVINLRAENKTIYGGLNFKVIFNSNEDQYLFLKTLQYLNLDSTDDVVFTDAVSMYLNVNYKKFFNTKPDREKLAL